MAKTKQDDFDYVLDQVKSLSKSDQKDIAEDILKRFDDDY